MKKRWTIEEEKQMQELYPEMGMVRMAKLLSRSYPSVMLKAQRLNLNINSEKYVSPKAGRSINRGSKNAMWKGNKVGYQALHAWVKRNLIKAQTCRECNKPKKLDLANISQNYKRDISDWEWLCRRCHMLKDGRLAALNKDISIIIPKGRVRSL